MTATECRCTGIGGLEASLKLNYVLVVPAEQAAMLHGELSARGVPERQIYEVDPNRRPRPHKSTICGPAAETSGAGGRRRGREKRFMPGSIRLGTYFAGGQQFSVCLRWGSIWISAVDRASGADGGGASEVTVAGGGGASEVSPVTDGGGVVEVQPAVDSGAAVVAVSAGINVPMEHDGGRKADEPSSTAVVRDCENGSDDPNHGNGDRRCNSSSTLCEDCKRWLLREYFGDRSHDELSDVNGRHSCIYRRIVDRLFVVTVTESSGDGDDEDEDHDAAACCQTTALDDIGVERPSTATDCTTTNVAGSSEPEQPLASPATLAQPAPSAPGEWDRVDAAAAENVAEKPKKRTLFGKFCKSNKKTKKNLEPSKTN